MKYLLDTNVLSDARKQAHPPLNAWIAAQIQADLAISVVSVLEIERGILQVERRDSAAGQHLRTWLESDVLPTFSGRILVVDIPVTRAATALHVPDPKPHMDALIAAAAIVHDLTLVTRNISDFERTGVRLLNPWELS